MITLVTEVTIQLRLGSPRRRWLKWRTPVFGYHPAVESVEVGVMLTWRRPDEVTLAEWAATLTRVLVVDVSHG